MLVIETDSTITFVTNGRKEATVIEVRIADIYTRSNTKKKEETAIGQEKEAREETIEKKMATDPPNLNRRPKIKPIISMKLLSPKKTFMRTLFRAGATLNRRLRKH